MTSQPRRVAAFFDLDKTVIAKSSALMFSGPLYRDGLIGRRAVVGGAFAHLFYRLNGVNDQQMLRVRDAVAATCAGWEAARVRRVVERTLRELVTPVIYGEARALIRHHQAAGHDVVIVSSSGAEVVEPIAGLLGVERVVATRMEVVDGRYTGQVAFYAAGVAKAQAIVELAGREGYDLSRSFAYSDSISDVPMLACVGRPMAVNPDRALRRMAAVRGWPVRCFTHPVPLRARLARRSGLLGAMSGVAVAAALVGGLLWYGARRARSQRDERTAAGTFPR